MLLPKNTLVALAGQNAWHICTGVALPRIVSGKYLPSQLRTQKAGPEPATRGAAAGGGAGCGLVPNGSAKKFACGGAARVCCFGLPPKNMSNRPSAATLPGTRTTDPAREIAAKNIARRRMREKANSVRNANSTQRN